MGNKPSPRLWAPFIRTQTRRQTLTLSKAHISSIKESWALLLEAEARQCRYADEDRLDLSPIGEFYDYFFSRLFELCPDRRPLYPSSLHYDGRALIGIVTALVQQLDCDTSDAILRLATKIQTRFSSGRDARSVRDDVGATVLILVESLAYCLGDSFEEHYKEAWLNLYASMLQCFS